MRSSSRSLFALGAVFLFGCASSAPEPSPPSSTQAAPSPEPLDEPPASRAAVKAEASLPTSPTATPPPPQKTGPPPPLPRGTVVAHFGDSMADALGKDLRNELQQRGIKAPLKYKEATYIPEWAGFKHNTSGFLAQHNPDLVIITLGGNESAMPDPNVRAEPVRRLVKKVGDRPCLWVAFPLWPEAPNTGILKVIEENCAPCRFVDTNALIDPKMEVLGDGVHPTLKERRRWAKFMIRWLRHNRDPNGPKPWSFKPTLEAPPPESVDWE